MVQDFRNDVGPVLHLEIHERWLSVLDFVQRWQFVRVRFDVRELPVVPDRPHIKRLFVFRRAERDRLVGAVLNGFDRGTRFRQFALEVAHLSGRDVLRLAPRCRGIGRDVDLQVWLAVFHFGQKE